MRVAVLFGLPLVAAVPLFVAGCPAALQDEGAPIDTRDNVLEQGMVDCTESQDTGYSHGNAFPITVVTVDGKPLEVATANAYVVMQAAAAADGVALRVVSGFRTMAEQQYLYGCYVNCNCNSCNLAAVPGTSNHQSGHALDLNTADGGVLDWLNAHGAAFGFARTVPSEVWHWEWWGGGPGGGPCGADQVCLDNPDTGGCDGTVVTRCDEDHHLGSGDCGVFGAGCSTEGGAPHCVHPLCLIHLDGGEDGSFCTDETRIGTCALGQYSEGDCGAYGGRCSETGGAHCVHYMCWSNLDGAEDGAFCKDAATLGTCTLGAYVETACDAGCVDDGGAHCAGAPPPAPAADNPPAADPPADDGVSAGDPGPDAAAHAGEVPPGADEADPNAGATPARLPPSVDDGGCASTRSAPEALGLLALAVVRARRRRRAGPPHRRQTP